MKRSFAMFVAALLSLVSAGTALAANRTFVTLAEHDATAHKLGMPGIALRIQDESGRDGGAIGEEVGREFVHQVFTRPLSPGETGDYDLTVDVGHPVPDGSSTVVPFEASLTLADGHALWRITGRTVVEDGAIDRSTFVGIGRNIVSSLIHDGWLAARYDPNDPPPQAPTLRLETGH